MFDFIIWFKRFLPTFLLWFLPASDHMSHPRFVIHKHWATHLHYDLRLEIGGVLISWAVPKGPSTDPKIKRLAMRVPDHPLSYFDFEGVIPEGSYGAGPVMVWDIGTYYSVKEEGGKIVPVQECLDDGNLIIFFEGTKLIGRYSLIRMHSSEKNWLLIKVNDEYAHKPPHLLEKNKSALTGRTQEQIVADAKNI